MQSSENEFNNDHIVDVIEDMTEDEKNEILFELFCKESVLTDWQRKKDQAHDRAKNHAEQIDYTPDYKDAA